MKAREAVLTISLATLLACRAQAATFEIAAGNAEETLGEWSRQAELQIFFSFRLVRGVRTNPVRGRMDALEALIVMLRGTTLVFGAANERMLVITDETYPLCKPELAAGAPLPPCTNTKKEDLRWLREL